MLMAVNGYALMAERRLTMGEPTSGRERWRRRICYLGECGAGCGGMALICCSRHWERRRMGGDGGDGWGGWMMCGGWMTRKCSRPSPRQPRKEGWSKDRPSQVRVSTRLSAHDFCSMHVRIPAAPPSPQYHSPPLQRPTKSWPRPMSTRSASGEETWQVSSS